MVVGKKMLKSKIEKSGGLFFQFEQEYPSVACWRTKKDVVAKYLGNTCALFNLTNPKQTYLPGVFLLLVVFNLSKITYQKIVGGIESVFLYDDRLPDGS